MRPVIIHDLLLTVTLLAMMMASCTSSATTSPESTAAPKSTEISETLEMEATMSLGLTSDAFMNGQSIPAKYSCAGKNISPALAWDESPAGTQSFALIMDDPDAPAGTWVHWVLFNIPAETRTLPEDLPITGKNVDPNAIYVGKNSWGDTGYGGPCPPSGTHRYYFKLYALDTTISLLPGATKEQLLKEMEGHILAQAELMGTFRK
ncbi:MAG: YbhB/YbcL family Raf kinase inhibitor-like protein [Chloroflexi bacterium]|nr:MAG: YbhB/YbcL family Raf kinase inhibitor-like protein [Chloroflexota bacterium]